MKRVKFWSRVSRNKSEEWMLVEGRDDSRVPISAWKAFNKAFWNWKMRGVFFPLDDLDVYQLGVSEMIRVADEPIKLNRASFSTYLVAAAYKTMLKYKERVVDAKRAEYRAMFDGCRVSTDEDPTCAQGEDKSDREWTCRNAKSLDVQAYAESLVGVHSAEREASARLAAVCVYETLPKLGADAQAGLKAWLEADGSWEEAAKLYGGTKDYRQRFYARFKLLWAPAFRKEVEWVW